MSSAWIDNRILEFFSIAKTVAEITRTVKNDPNSPSPTSIGRTLAKRILDARTGRFWKIEELLAIPGMTTDKYQDLVFTFGVPAVLAFEKSLFENQLLADNWTFFTYDYGEESAEAFQQRVDDEATFRKTVRFLVERAIAETAGHDAPTAEKLSEPLVSHYIDSYHNSTEEAALAFALWFYRFAADNWFSFDRMLTETNKLFTYHAIQWDMQLRFFRGFDNQVFTQLIAPRDLPVLVNYPEQKITIFVVGLAD